TDLDSTFAAIADEAAIAMRRFRHFRREQRLHAFVGVGWVREANDAPLRPAIHHIDNFRNLNEFELTRIFVGPAGYGVHSSKDLPRRLLAQHNRRLEECRRRGTGAAGPARA